MPLLGLRDRFDTCIPGHIRWKILCLSSPFQCCSASGTETLQLTTLEEGEGEKIVSLLLT